MKYFLFKSIIIFDSTILIKCKLNHLLIVFITRKTINNTARIATILANSDLAITPELKEEGILRDLIREIQAARKKAGLKPKDKVAAQISLPKEILEAAKKYEKDLMKETNLKSSQFSESSSTKILFQCA